ncbi:hypothetical protein EVAR_20763_1 [Eumeta japonica]|uniref:Uncharacterized protein n=1 Tax=Eumeta variegata TaxID=151549 RepID=A0A4C1V9Y4_EUMVA|nr:hypothetical protein EVAR_20763_1 [Eumeta japonica]
MRANFESRAFAYCLAIIIAGYIERFRVARPNNAAQTSSKTTTPAYGQRTHRSCLKRGPSKIYGTKDNIFFVRITVLRHAVAAVTRVRTVPLRYRDASSYCAHDTLAINTPTATCACARAGGPSVLYRLDNYNTILPRLYSTRLGGTMARPYSRCTQR